jgi:hypothetical protein
MIIAGRISWLIFTVISSFAMLLFLILSKKGIYDPQIRRHPGIDAIDEAVSRAVEMGRPVSYCPGGGSLYDSKYAGDTAAALSLLGYVAKISVEKGARLIVPIMDPTILSVAQEIVKTAYRLGDAEYIEGDTVRYLSPDSWAFGIAYAGMLYDERPATSILFGLYSAHFLLMTESGVDIGAFQIAGTTNVLTMPFAVSSCDFALLGEDEYAAAAYVDPDPVQRGVILGQDIAKVIVIILLVAGALLSTVGNNLIRNILSW